MPLSSRFRLAFAILALQVAPAFADDASDRRDRAIKALDAFVAGEVAAKKLPALSIAVVDGPTIAWAKGFGFADRAGTVAATAKTVYRVGSVSKLFTDLAVMTLADQGKVDIDAPVTTYLPDFKPTNPSGTPITLRQMMAHRSGLGRETPVGSYFDPSQPSLAASVTSLNQVALIHPPGTTTSDSNAAVAAVGLALERVAGEPFAKAIERRVLAPLGMTRSRFDADPALDADRAEGTMHTSFGRDFAAPTFTLGSAPAGCMSSTVIDLGRFLIALMDDANVPINGLPRPETLAAMLTPQFAPAGTTEGFGLGFVLGRFQGHKRVGHSGAIYGFSAELAALPDAKLGVVVVASKDFSNGVTSRIADVALGHFLAASEARPLPPIATTTPLPPGLVKPLAGHYQSGEDWFDLIADGPTLRMVPAQGFSRELRVIGDDLTADDLIGFGPTFVRESDALRLGAKLYVREPVPLPPPAPDRFAGLIGEYGWDHETLYVLERDGKLNVLIDWFELDPLAEGENDTYKFPERSFYAGDTLRFRRDASGRATQVTAASVVFPRRTIDGEGGRTFRITPNRPVADILRDIDANGDKPPTEPGTFRAPDLIDLASVSPTIRFDIRYATANNFLGTPLYPSAKAFFQRPAAEALGRVHRALAAKGYGLLIHDSYRPWRITKLFWDATSGSDRNFVANPVKGSKHNRGCAVDLSLYDLTTGKPATMVGGYDEFSDRSYPDYPGGTSRQRWLRDLLRDAMEAEGFTVNGNEWWHFDYKDWANYPILDVPFSALPDRP